MPIFIQSAKQISVQMPLSDKWFDQPIFYEKQHVRSIDPELSSYFSPLISRRMCLLQKRAVILSQLTLKDASIKTPDAIICGTGTGFLENTEFFLHSILDNDEKFLQPTYFMQSTPNMLSSTVAIDIKCNGYNNTFVHRGTSFENVLLDAILQFEQKRVTNVLAGGFDELTDEHFVFFSRTGSYNFEIGENLKKRCFASEVAVSMLLEKNKTEKSICEINDVKLMHKPSYKQIQDALTSMLTKSGCNLSEIDAVLTGLNNNTENDKIYHDINKRFFSNIPILQFKHLFGESLSSSAIGVYVALTCLRKGYAPSILSAENDEDTNNIKRILIHNHYKNNSHSIILLSKV